MGKPKSKSYRCMRSYGFPAIEGSKIESWFNPRDSFTIEAQKNWDSIKNFVTLQGVAHLAEKVHNDIKKLWYWKSYNRQLKKKDSKSIWN